MTHGAEVTLAPLALEHAPRMYAWMLDPEVSGGIGLTGEPSLERTEVWIRTANGDPSVHAFAIFAGGEHVGNVVLDRIDQHLRTARFSIYLGAAAARGRGIGTAATRLAAAHGFEILRLHKIWLVVHAENPRARAAYERAGFRVEGVLRDEFLLAGRRLDALRMGLLANELTR